MKRWILIIAAGCLLASCHNDYTPKPHAYLRIDLPEHNYWLVDTLPTSVDGQTMPSVVLPFLFEANDSAELTLKKPRQVATFMADGSVRPGRNKYDEVWLDINYPRWNGVVFLTYHRMHGPADLRGEVDSSLRYLEQHYQIATGVEEQGYEDPEHKVYGNVYYLKGSKVASTCQFWLTDSNSHYLRGALYLNVSPNNDSLAPVIDYLQADVEHLVETLRWR